MNQDALTLAAIRDELEALLIGGRVQRVLRPTALSLGLEIYTGQRHHLLLSAEPQEARVALAEERLRRGVETSSPLQLLLRKYVQGARLKAIRQPPWERILHWHFDGPHGEVVLISEIMGRLSNLILTTADGTILEAAKRIPSRINRYRVILPGMAYAPPPPQDKLDLKALSIAQLASLLDQQEGPTARRLAQVVQGISPLVAREALFRATGRTDPPWPLSHAALERLYEALSQLLHLFESRAWEPSVGYIIQGENRIPIAYAPYPLTHCDAYERLPSLAKAADRPLQGPPRDSYAPVRAHLRAQISEAIKRLQARLDSLTRALVPMEEIEALQWQGKAILALAWRIKPGQETLRVSRGEITGETGQEASQEIEIPLQPELSPAENAQRLFREYRKRKAAATRVPAEIEKTQREIAYLEQLLVDIDLAENRPELDQIQKTLQAAGYLPGQARPHQATSQPLQVTAQEGFLILVGRNSRQNEEITFHQSRPDDLWLHARGVPGGHVIIRCGGHPVSPETLRLAASLAAYYSAARHERQVAVDITERRYVRRLPEGGPGMVTYRQETTLLVTPEPPPATR